MKKIAISMNQIEMKLSKLKLQLGHLRSETLLASQEVSGATQLLAETLRTGLIRIKNVF